MPLLVLAQNLIRFLSRHIAGFDLFIAKHFCRR
jgi:hypothetical protein